ncbi:hypothetical protein RB195_016748 [Necator americanus]|uniref:PUL domain protein n=1 Tax=Necator americanus TaxID=51031 RepID=A0ABR1C1Z5_NECAM
MSDVEMSDTTEGEGFRLSRVIDAHKSDVKCLASTSAGVIISGGRDETVKFWSKRGGEFSETLAFPQPKGLAVNSVAYYESPEGWRVFAGRKDGSIAVYGSGSSEPLSVLTQHSSNVCCLYVDEKNHILLSGSWDNNIIIWPIREIGSPEFPVLLLNGHKLSVWALCAIESNPGYYLSGSADKTVKLWHNDNEVRTYTVLFSLAFVDSHIASCSEGGYVEIWKQNTIEGQLSLSHAQLLQSPALTLWAVKGLPNGDIACAASDGKIYVFTENENRKASAAVAAAYDDAIAVKVAKELERKERQANETVVIKVSLDDGAPNMELRYKKGTDPALAAEKFIQDNNLPASYLNEITDYIKAHVPEAAAAAQKQHKVQPTQRVIVDGKEYDYCFDVTVDDGRKLRLPYNLSEDPDVAAQRFVEKHNLPISFLAKVSGLLRSQTSGAQGAFSGQFYDPFTGSGRYVPSQGSTFSSNGSADPLTDSGRYIPGNSYGDFPPASSGDPLTSSGGYHPGSASGDIIPSSCLPVDKRRPRGELTPMANYYRFGVEQLSTKAITKLFEVNDKQTALRLNETQLQAIQRLMSASSTNNDYEMLVMALETGLQWDIEDLVPILDVFRVAILDETLNSYFCDMKGRGESTQQRLSALLLSEPPDAISILVCRCITNAFVHSRGREMVSHDFQILFRAVANHVTSHKPALQIAAASALANWSLLLLNRSETVAELGPREDAIREIIKVCEDKVTSFGSFAEVAMIRLLQAIVTFMWGDTTVINLAKSRNMLSIVNRIKDAVADEKGKSIARDIAEMIYAV